MDNVSSTMTKEYTIKLLRDSVNDAGGDFCGVQTPLLHDQPHVLVFLSRETGHALTIPILSGNFHIADIVTLVQDQIVHDSHPKKRSTMTDTPKLNLRQKLIEVYKRVDHVEKAGRNEKQKYDFVRAADVLRSIRNAFADLGIYAETNYDLLGVYDIKTNSGGTMHTATVKAFIRLLDADSDETLTISGLGDGADSGDKGIFKAQTGATKNALRNGTLLPDVADPYAMDPEADQAVDNATDFSTSSRYQPQDDAPDFREAQHAAPNPLPTPRAQKPTERPTPAFVSLMPPVTTILPQDEQLPPPPPDVPAEEQNQGPAVAPEHGDAREGDRKSTRLNSSHA